MANIIEITNFMAPELDVYARLTEGQLRSRQNAGNAMFIAESPKVIGHALDAGYEPLSLLMEKKHISGQGAAIIERCGDIPVYTGESAILEKLTGFQLTRGILCAMRRPLEANIHEILHSAHRIAVIEGVVDLPTWAPCSALLQS
jgi:tRNA G18 (ribose-2'-O)-methylase SpoU